jgi:tetratricopeptide (TPR) repeat protein
VYFSPDNRWLVSAAQSDDSHSYLAYRVGSWERGMSQSAEFGTPVRVAFSADGRLMAMGISPTQVLIVDPADGREIMQLTDTMPHGAWPAAFSDDGSELVLGASRQPMAWWNLRRLDEQLQKLGLAWDAPDERLDESRTSTVTVRNAVSVATSNEWDTIPPTARTTVHVDLGELPQRNAANERAAHEQSRLAQAFEEARSWASARAALERALELSPDDANAHNSLAWLLATCPDQTHRDAARAVAVSSRTVELQPDNAAYRNTLGVAHYRAGDWRAAITDLTKAEELAPQQWFAHNAFFISMSHWQLGDRDAARVWYAKAVAWGEKNQAGDPQNDEELRRFRAEAEDLIGRP